MRCLNCDNEMDLISSKGIAYHQCMACGSAWLAPESFRALRGRAAPEWDDDAIKARLQLPQRCRWCDTLYPPGSHCEGCDRPLEHRCPQDGDAMFIVEEQGIEVDVCLKCMGIWFDRRELDQLLKLDTSASAHRAPAASVVVVEMPSIEAPVVMPVAAPEPPQECQVCGYPYPSDALTFIEGFLRCKDCCDDITAVLEAFEGAPPPKPSKPPLPRRPDGPILDEDNGEYHSIVTAVSQLVYGPRDT